MQSKLRKLKYMTHAVQTELNARGVGTAIPPDIVPCRSSFLGSLMSSSTLSFETSAPSQPLSSQDSRPLSSQAEASRQGSEDISGEDDAFLARLEHVSEAK